MHYVPRDDPSSLMTLSSHSHSHRLLGLSPGQQPWPAAGELKLNFASLVAFNVLHSLIFVQRNALLKFRA